MKAHEDIIYYASPVGILRITGDGAAITGIEFEEKAGVSGQTVPIYLADCLKQLDEYFEGRRNRFDLKLAPRGTEFQRRVWRALPDIGFGSTASYVEIARRIGRPQAPRAVGQANNRNPLSIVVPCHRVIGSNGAMVGYGGGLWRKEWLLAHERSFSEHP